MTAADSPSIRGRLPCEYSITIAYTGGQIEGKIARPLMAAPDAYLCGGSGGTSSSAQASGGGLSHHEGGISR
jgi:hypothetical protein